MPSSVRRLSRWQLGWMWTSRSSNVGCDHHAVWTGPCVWTTVPSHHILPPRRNEERVFLEDIDRLDQASRYSENVSCDDHVLTTGDRALLTGGWDAVNKTATFYWLDAGAFPRGIPRAKKVKTRKQQKVCRNVVQSASFCSFSR